MASAPARTTATAPSTQSQRASLPVSKPSDRSEQEATRIASRVAQADPARIALLPKAAKPTSAAPAGSGGQALPAPVQLLMERQLGIALDGVRLHTDANAAREADQLDARAFTVGGDIFFGAGQYRPESAEGRELIAHELVHTVQQGATKQQGVQRSLLPGAEVQERSPPMIQRGLFARALKKARSYLAGLADGLPGYRLFCLAIGHNPIAGTDVARDGPNVLRAIAGVVPFGDTILETLQNHGIIDKGAQFVSSHFGALKALGSGIISDVKAFISDLGLSDVVRPGKLWDRIKTLARSSIGRVVGFFGNLVSQFAALVRDAILKPLGKFAAANVPHWDLLVGVLGENPVSKDGESPASALIGAFMTLIGQEEVWNNIKKSGAIGKAWTWFKTAMAGAKALVVSIPGRVLGIFKGLGITDLLTLPKVFGRIFDTLKSFVSDFMSWAGSTVLNLLEIILSVVAPAALPYLKKAGAAFKTIIRNPIGFVRNLVSAGKLGFQNFAGNFLTHLKAALIGWLTGSLAGSGVYIPQGFNLREILKFVASVLGLTWAQIRVRLVAAVGETAVKAMETGFALVKTLITEGPAAAWQQIVEAVGNLKSMAIDAVMDYVKSKIVSAAVTKLLSMLSPAGAFIQALIAIYNTIMFFVERLRQIAAVAASFIDSIAAIANGTLGPAAARVERTLAGLLVLVVSFLARIAGLGKVSDAINNLIKKIRAPIEKALDKVIAWVVAQARKLGRFVAQAGVPNDPAKRLELAANHAVTLARPLAGKATAPLLTGALSLLKTRYALTTLTVREEGDDWVADISINPNKKKKLGVGGKKGKGKSGGGAAGKPATPAAGPDWGPIIAKLDQAVAMFTEWASNGSSSVGAQVLNKLQAARTKAKALAADQKAGKTGLDARRTALGTELRTIQTLDPDYELVSIGELEVTIKKAKKKMPAKKLSPFTMLDPSWRSIYVEQLAAQQAGINAMTLNQMEGNKDLFVLQGRGKREKKLRGEFNKRFGNQPGTAAPHNPDKGWALGFDDPTGEPADSDVNSHIGSQGRGKKQEIIDAVMAVKPLARVITQANFLLVVQ
ncbi:eCIS core domain-containing protein [Sandarakinorhabdus oryzae]|uniref:eCIS core domain-containing protein n=1 Tax=Sandarakinorhabdus oryzae TaxID=2675220 RepID=UPI0012E1B439|nr:DUF4157 domain-containing protein [Sandarakinorhabdus oryzae]